MCWFTACRMSGLPRQRQRRLAAYRFPVCLHLPWHRSSLCCSSLDAASSAGNLSNVARDDYIATRQSLGWVIYTEFIYDIKIRYCLYLELSQWFIIIYVLYKICSIKVICITLMAVANPDQYFRYIASFICHNFAYICNSCIAFHLSITLDTCQIYWNDSSILQDKKKKNSLI